MCNAKPSLRCETHIQADLKKSRAMVSKYEAQAEVLKQRGAEIPEKLNAYLNRTRATLMRKEQDRLELLFHQYITAKAKVITANEIADGEDDDFTKKARLIVAEVEALQQYQPQYAELIAKASRDRNNAGKYLRTKTLPETNEEIIEMLTLINAERTTRTKKDGKWDTQPNPLTPEEQVIKDTAVKLLKRGISEPAHVTERKALEKEQAEQQEQLTLKAEQEAKARSAELQEKVDSEIAQRNKESAKKRDAALNEIKQRDAASQAKRLARKAEEAAALEAAAQQAPPFPQLRKTPPPHLKH